MRMLLPAGHAGLICENHCGIGQAIGVISFLAMPSASATARPQRIAALKSSNATTRSTHGHAGASGISSAVTMPVVP